MMNIHVRNIIGIFAIFFFEGCCILGWFNPITNEEAHFSEEATRRAIEATGRAFDATYMALDVPETPTPSITATVSPTTTQTVVPTTTQTVTSTVTVKPDCLIPLAPPDSSSFGSFGEISFSWDSNVDAASFVVAVTAPNGTVMTFPAKDSGEYSRWIESFPWGGEFTWQVLALDPDGNVLCRSASMRFTKPVTEPSQTAVPRSKPPSPVGTTALSRIHKRVWCGHPKNTGAGIDRILFPDRSALFIFARTSR